jgi:hypothetical protein
LPINVAELTAWSADFLSGKLRCRQSGRRAYVGIGRKAFKIWLTASIVWIIAIVTAIYAGAVFPVGYQANFPLRTDLEPWNDEWPINGPLRHPLYEIIRSPAAEKLPLTFQWRGYSLSSTGRWNEHIHARDLPRFRFPGGETLDLPADLTDTDREYVKQVFWDQRWKRWEETLGPFVRSAIFVPLGFFVVLWLARRFKIARSGKELEPERPRLPYSPAIERLRNITLAVSAIEILLWLVIAVLNDREDPQALADVISIMFVAMLPTNLAFIMSLLRRGPLTAAALAGLGLWMLLPQLTVRIFPSS